MGVFRSFAPCNMGTTTKLGQICNWPLTCDWAERCIRKEQGVCGREGETTEIGRKSNSNENGDTQ